MFVIVNKDFKYKQRANKNCCIRDVGRGIIAYHRLFYLFITRACYSSLEMPSKIALSDTVYGENNFRITEPDGSGEKVADEKQYLRCRDREHSSQHSD